MAGARVTARCWNGLRPAPQVHTITPGFGPDIQSGPATCTRHCLSGACFDHRVPAAKLCCSGMPCPPSTHIIQLQFWQHPAIRVHRCLLTVANTCKWLYPQGGTCTGVSGDRREGLATGDQNVQVRVSDSSGVPSTFSQPGSGWPFTMLHSPAAVSSGRQFSQASAKSKQVPALREGSCVGICLLSMHACTCGLGNRASLYMCMDSVTQDCRPPQYLPCGSSRLSHKKSVYNKEYTYGKVTK